MRVSAALHAAPRVSSGPVGEGGCAPQQQRTLGHALACGHARHQLAQRMRTLQQPTSTHALNPAQAGPCLSPVPCASWGPMHTYTHIRCSRARSHALQPRGDGAHCALLRFGLLLLRGAR